MDVNFLIRQAGITLGDSQRAGNMVVVPLLTSHRVDSIGAVENFWMSPSTEQNKVKTVCCTKSAAIAPMGLAYLDGDSPAITPRATVIEGESSIDSFRLQEQPLNHQFTPDTLRGLPCYLKKAIYAQKKSGSNRFQANLDQFNQAVCSYDRMSVGGTISELYARYAQEAMALSSFFELIDSQIGAVILIDGILQGIEIYPSVDSFAWYFQTLIKDCYAIDSVASRNPRSKPSQITLDNPSSLDKLVDSVYRYQAQERNWINSIILQAFSEKFPDWESNSEKDDCTRYQLKGKELQGEAILDSNGRLLYCNLMRMEVCYG